jgi:hypothetical protein
MKEQLSKLNRLIETVCGVYSRVARRLGVDRDGVSGDPGHPDDSRRRLADRANVRAGPCVTKLRELEDFHF